MDFGVWNAAFMQAPLHDEGESGARLWLDLHARRDSTKLTGIIRPAIGWDLSEQTTIYAGYAAIPAWVPGEGTTIEHRIWQQAMWSATLGQVGIGLRPRLEQRFADEIDGVGLRLRFFERIQLKLPDPWAVVVWDEVFVAINESGFVPAGFDQNRLFVGPALRVSPMRFEFGFLDQLLLREGEWSHVGVFASNVFITF